MTTTTKYNPIARKIEFWIGFFRFSLFDLKRYAQQKKGFYAFIIGFDGNLAKM